MAVWLRNNGDLVVVSNVDHWVKDKLAGQIARYGEACGVEQIPNVYWYTENISREVENRVMNPIIRDYIRHALFNLYENNHRDTFDDGGNLKEEDLFIDGDYNTEFADKLVQAYQEELESGDAAAECFKGYFDKLVELAPVAIKERHTESTR